MSVFELSEIQAQYILDTPLRRLTRYDRLELERERETLQREIDDLTAILESEPRLRALVSAELGENAERFASPRRTVLLEGSGKARTAAVPLEVADDPCLVLLSSAGLIARTATHPAGEPAEGTLDAAAQDGAAAPAPAAGPRAAHDVIIATAATTARGTTAVVTSQGRLIRLGVLEIPALPPSAHSPSLAGGAPIAEFVALEAGETVVGLAAPDGSAGGLALGTAGGVVKRVAPDYPASATEFEVISLKDGDRVVGAVQLDGEDADLVFITTDAQLLRFRASAVRPQGRAAGGMAGVRLSAGAAVAWFGALPDSALRDSALRDTALPDGSLPDGGAGAVVVTVAGSSHALPGTAAATVKVTPYEEYPAKGRATGGVRCHRFLKGEDTLVLAWAGPGPARAATDAGVPVYLPDPEGRRDGSGERIRQGLAALGGSAPPR
jgi:DNA gyrase subunit A